MDRLTSKLIIYRNIPADSILFELAGICRRFRLGLYDKDELIADIYTQVHRLLDVATAYGFDQDLWHDYLAFLLATTENPFTLVSEKTGALEGSVQQLVRGDFDIFRKLFDYDFSEMEEKLGINCFSVIQNYEAVVKEERIFNKNVSDKVRELSGLIEVTEDARQMYDIVTDFYRRYGVGSLGLNKAFKISDKKEGPLLEPVVTTTNVVLSDLVGYELQKSQLIENTEAFVRGKPANNVLLYGDAGTGKSTSVKAILNQYYDRGLRMVEIYKHQFQDLSKVISAIKDRNYRFILFMDDLSFEEYEIEYKYLKAVIEGGLETRPENVLIYATSNRRNLIRETWSERSDRSDDEFHRSDNLQEKLSLAGRFGVTIAYYNPQKKQFDEIVRTLAARHPEITLTEEELLLQANAWEMRHGGKSGRTAQQFIDYLLGKMS